MYFLGIKLDNLTLEQARLKVRDFLVLPGQFKIFTPNPEMVVKAQKDENFKMVLNSGDLNICDGFGLSLFSGAPRITGVDFMLEICKIAEEAGKSIFLLGTEKKEILEKTAKQLQNKFPKLKIVGYDTGPIITDCHSECNEESLKVCNKINQSKAEILFGAFGMVKQEKWISENINKLSTIKIAMGVGGSFDYISGIIPRAPLFMRRIGLEWLYRLIRQPQRFWRIFNATFKFLFLVLSKKI